MLIEALTLALLGQVEIPSMTVPPTSEKTVIFHDRGRVYVVGSLSGKVQVLDNAPAPNPTPDDDDVTPDPVPPPAPTAYKWANVVIERNDVERNAWRDSAAIRDAVKAKDGRIIFIASDESDIDSRGLRRHITANGLPMVVLQDKDGKVVLSKPVKTEAELLEVLK